MKSFVAVIALAAYAVAASAVAAEGHVDTLSGRSAKKMPEHKAGGGKPILPVQGSGVASVRSGAEIVRPDKAQENKPVLKFNPKSERGNEK